MTCESCEGTSFVYPSDDTVRRCACSAIDPLKMAGVPMRERRDCQRELMTSGQHRIFERAAPEVLAGGSVLLVGPAGVGKTGVGVCLLRLAAEKGKSIGWIRLGQWLSGLRDSFDRRGAPAPSSDMDLVSPLLERDVLVVDDLGAEQRTEWARVTAEQLIDERDSSALPLIVTTNLPLDAKSGDSIMSVYGDRMCSRLSRCQRHVFRDMPDLRRRQTPPEARA